MASSSIPEKVRKLDPTKLAATSFVRRPNIKGKIIQGKERQQGSRAARKWREHESARLKKALKHVTHGKNIFAYNHLRTNQVVYSLTRALDYRSVLPQLIYHGKKTVPPNLRKDMWTPYFSLHFSSSAIGLKAYRILRELSVQRQLSPNPEDITITEEVLARSRPRDPLKAEEFDEEWKKRVGMIMDKKRRARVLMDQKASSVADVAATLQWQNEEHARQLERGEEEGGDDEKNLSKKARKRLRKARRQEEEKRQQIQARLDTLTQEMSEAKGAKLELGEPEHTQEYDVPEGEVKILWADLEDARHAEAWPEGVSHGELRRTRDHIIKGAKRDRNQPLPIEDVAAPVEEESTTGSTTEQVQPEPETSETPAPGESEPKEGESSWKKKLKFW